MAVAAAGAIVYAMGVSDHNSVTGAAGYGNPQQVDPMTEAAAQKLVDSGDTKKMWGGIALGVGGAAIASSIVMFMFNGPHADVNKESGGLALQAGPLKGGGQMVLEGRF